MRRAIAAAAPLERVAWVLSNHDFRGSPHGWATGRLALRPSLLLTLPGAAFIYQGDEIGMPDGPEGDPPIDRAGPRPPSQPDAVEPGPLGGSPPPSPGSRQSIPSGVASTSSAGARTRSCTCTGG